MMQACHADCFARPNSNAQPLRAIQYACTIRALGNSNVQPLRAIRCPTLNSQPSACLNVPSANTRSGAPEYRGASHHPTSVPRACLSPMSGGAYRQRGLVVLRSIPSRSSVPVPARQHRTAFPSFPEPVPAVLGLPLRARRTFPLVRTSQPNRALLFVQRVLRA